jgi:hypothetical protein
MAKSVPVFLLLSLVAGCQPTPSTLPTNRNLSADFKKYWYSGQAEINSYLLEQSRYGESRAGTAVLIFVTEDFSRKKQVKLDHPASAGDDKVSVLKMNFTKNFITGIYPYSMMLSTFTPLSVHSHSLKVSMSSQEWCGQVYSQMNQTQAGYQLQSHSYFEKEGDEEIVMKETWLEDELWNVLRISPGDLPIGKFDLIPGLFFSRLLHTPLTVTAAEATLLKEATRQVYSLHMPSLERSLSISFEDKPPYKIIGWEETFPERGKQVTTRATLNKTLLTDYWTKNSNAFLPLRDSLGLTR